MSFDGLKSMWLTKKVILQHNVGDNKLHNWQKLKPGEVAKWHLSAGKSLAPGASPTLTVLRDPLADSGSHPQY